MSQTYAYFCHSSGMYDMSIKQLMCRNNSDIPMTTRETEDYCKHFAEECPVTFGLISADGNPRVTAATVMSVQGDRISLQFPEDQPADPVAAGARMVLTTQDDWVLRRCEGVIEEYLGETVRARLVGPVEVQQRREYFRLDVWLPVLHVVPEHQELARIQQEWHEARMARSAEPPPIMLPARNGFRVVQWHRRRSIRPIRTNLSGNGLRLKTEENLSPGTLVEIQIFLPLALPRVILAVGSVIRSDKTGNGNHPSFITSLHFELIDERDRDAIISFLFSQQRNLIQEKADQKAKQELDQ